MYPKDYLYTEDHEWLKVEEDGVVSLGITSFAQSELGEVVFVELPEADADFAAGDELGTIESVKAVAEFYTPVEGTVIEANGELEDAPELVNEDPQGKGWLVKLRLKDAGELPELMSAEAYEAFIKDKQE
ncbi:MAG: glycine cleavage system protein GcvH [Acidobacteriota bacterium]